MFKRVIGKKCTKDECGARDVLVDTSLSICEECGLELTSDTVVNKTAVVTASVLLIGIFAGVSYFAAIRVKHFLAAEAAETVVEMTAPLTDAARARIKGLIAEIQKGGDTSEAQRQLEELKRSHGLSGDEIEKLRQEAAAQQDKGDPQSNGDADKKLARLLRSVYSDGVKTSEEQQEIDNTYRRYGVDPSVASQREQEIKDRLSRSGSALKQGLVYASQRNYAQAVKEFKHSTEVDPENAFAWANLAAAYLNLDRQDEAQAACDRALSLDPGNWLAHYNRGSLYAKSGDRDRALEKLSEALHLIGDGQSNKVTREEVIEYMRTDQTLDSLRQDARFRELLR